MKNTIQTAIIGGGASGLFLASMLDGKTTAVFERGERVGKKLSATGNGQGNISNLQVEEGGYFSHTLSGETLARMIVKRYGLQSLKSHLQKLGLLLTTDDRKRLYPAGKQASAITDALRFYLAEQGTSLYTGVKIDKIERTKEGFCLISGEDKYYAETVVLCTGGKAGKHFGTDGNGYSLAQAFGHTITPLYPALVQLKTQTADIKTLKGIRVSPACVSAEYEGKKNSLVGDLLFTEYGVSGDVIFRLSSFIADKIERGVKLYINFLPEFTNEEIATAVKGKRARYPEMPFGELLCGIVNNQVGRAVAKKSGEDIDKAIALLQAFPIEITGSLGFDYAQVTKGGITISEVDENLQSKKVQGLYFAGEILDIDGECGGYNIQWAYSSACTVANAINEKARGQV